MRQGAGRVKGADGGAGQTSWSVGRLGGCLLDGWCYEGEYEGRGVGRRDRGSKFAGYFSVSILFLNTSRAGFVEVGASSLFAGRGAERNFFDNLVLIWHRVLMIFLIFLSTSKYF